MSTGLTETLPRCTAGDIGIEISGEDAGPYVAALNEYLRVFAKPAGGSCLSCGKTLGGPFGSFVFLYVNGEGMCANCQWPCRAHHRPTIDGAPMFTRSLDIVLQYHPDYVSTDQHPGDDIAAAIDEEHER